MTDAPDTPAWFDPPTRPLHLQPIDTLASPHRRPARRIEPTVLLAGVVMVLLVAGVAVGLATM